ncbi:MAG: hypothetical protein IPL84_01805 [Chitinophagaceae bacterium]|nr:hypothetical protein [Chitinophagaceae bacterium]
MNSYNENLQAAVIASLQNQWEDLMRISSKTNAALFTRYYTQGDSLSAADKLAEAKVLQLYKESVKAQAVVDGSISRNMLLSATQANQYQQQTVSNSAIAAANVQVAAAAIVRLASDIGSIDNLVNATQIDDELSLLTSEVNKLISDTAYSSEFVSQIGMEASIAASKVSASAVLENAKIADATMDSLLKVVSADYDNISQEVVTENIALAGTIAQTKLADGNYLDSNAIQSAATDACTSTNNGLNLGLEAIPAKGNEGSQFNVCFKPLTNPFGTDGASGTGLSGHVQQYYLFVVKAFRKSTFSISRAESIIQNTNGSFKAIDTTVFTGGMFSRIYSATDLTDTDGEKIGPGTNYVVFVLAVYHEEYKKYLNNYENFLTAPSIPFKLTSYLAKATSIAACASVKGKPKTIKFKVTEPKADKGSVEYRCLFLQLGDNGILPEFEFNLVLAEQVSPANYTTIDNGTATDDGFTITDSTTDNFGNGLSSARTYLPVILSVSIDKEQSASFTNSLSDFSESTPFHLNDN